MLCGSNSKSVTRNRLDKLSTFGLLGHLKQQQVVQLIDALLAAGLLETTEIEPFRPIVQVTEPGEMVMKGGDATEVRLSLPEEITALLADRAPAGSIATERTEQAAFAPEDIGLVARLKRWRDETRLTENVPAYRVLTNAALDELARTRPQSLEGLSAVKGMGPAKVRQYGEALLALLGEPVVQSPTAQESDDPADVATNAHADAEQAAPRPIDEPADAAIAAPPSNLARPSHYWTWRLLDAGFSPDECAEIRGLAPEVVLDHALRAADHGLAVNAGWFLTADRIERIEDVLGDGATTRIRAALECLPRGTRYEEVQLVVKARQFALRQG